MATSPALMEATNMAIHMLSFPKSNKETQTVTTVSTKRHAKTET